MLSQLQNFQAPMPKNSAYYGQNPLAGNLWSNPVHIPPKIKSQYYIPNMEFYK